MRVFAIALLAAGCRGPDRWHTSVARGQGDISSPKADFDTEETTLEIGVSGPIGSPPDRRYPVMPVYAPAPVVTPTPKPTDDDWGWVGPVATALVAILGALAGVKYTPNKYLQGPFDKERA